MLVLTRKIEQGINIGDGISIVVKEIKGSQVRLGIEAPANLKIYRSEIFEQIMLENARAITHSKETRQNLNNFAQSVKFTSSRFGELEIQKDTIINFPNGFVGMPDVHQFTLLEYSESFSWLHSIDNPNIAFVVMSGAQFAEIYSGRIPALDHDIDLKPEDPFAIVNIISTSNDVTNTSVNLKAPIIVNLRNRQAKQIIIDAAEFPINFYLFKNNE